MDKQEWSIALRSFSHSQRQSNSIPDRYNFSEEEEWQCRVIGGELISWIHDRLPDILRQRTALPIRKFDPEPLAIFTTTNPGLAAAQEIILESSEEFVYLLHEEYEEWEKSHPIDEFTFHVHHWSYFCECRGKLLARARERRRSHETQYQVATQRLKYLYVPKKLANSDARKRHKYTVSQRS